MQNNSKSMVMFETGVTPYAMQALTDSGDHILFDTQATELSETDGNSPDIRPNGVLTGLVGSVAVSGGNDKVDVSAGTAYLQGVKTAISAALDQSITRPATDVAKINSVTVTSAGAIAVLPGTDGTDANFSEGRGVAGSAPFIPVDSIELYQIRVGSSTAAPITASEIFAVAGTHRELSNSPSFKVMNYHGQVKFASALPLVHTGNVAKAVYGSYAEPLYAEQEFANDFVPAEISHSSSSEQVYNDVVGNTTESLGQASFTALLNDGITDPILDMVGQSIFIKYYQHRQKSPYILTQGKLATSRTFGAANNPKVSCTITPTSASVNRGS